MDSLYLTALQDDHLSLQQMMDDDLKREMDLDDCFSFGGDLPSLALDDSLDCKWEFVDNSTSVSNLLSRHTPLHSPTFDANIWYNAGGSSNSNLAPVLENDAASRMVNPNTVIPINSLSPLPMEIEIKREPIDEPVSSPIVVKAEPHVEPPIPQQITFATTTTQLPARAKIINKGISLVCSNTNTPFTFVKTNTFNVSNNTLSINEGMATIRCPPARPNKTLQQNPEEKIYPKPAYSYSCLIALALKNSANGSLPVSEIYNFMCEHFPYFKTAPNGWKNSVRHNLSLNKCFEKIEKPSGNGSQRKGCLWAMNPTKLSKMDEEVQKWSRKDPQAIRRAMVIPENLEMLERGEMKRDVASGDDTEEDEDEELNAISPHEEQPFTPPDTEEADEVDPIGTNIKNEHEFVDISYLEELDENDIPEFDLDVNDRLYEEMEEEENMAVTRIEASLHHNTTKIQGNYIYKPSPISRPMATAPVSSYVCKPTANGTAVRIRKVQPAILLSSVKRH